MFINNMRLNNCFMFIANYINTFLRIHIIHFHIFIDAAIGFHRPVVINDDGVSVIVEIYDINDCELDAVVELDLIFNSFLRVVGG